MLSPIRKPTAELQFYTLPLEPGTLKLSIDTLNSNSAFRFPKRAYIQILLRKMSFKNEILTLSVKLDKEAEERVYIKVKQTAVHVYCSVDTHRAYLSRYAYFALYQLISVYKEYDFSPYYWPDFFDPATGRSKYLNIINDRAGMDITVKPEYPAFYKPGQTLFYPSKDMRAEKRSVAVRQKDTIDTYYDSAIGYCLADALCSSYRPNHYPLLLPYSGWLTATKAAIKEFFTFILDQDMEPYEYTYTQVEIKEVCGQMNEVAKCIVPEPHGIDKKAVQNSNATNMRKLFDLWEQALPLLYAQSLTHFFDTFGLRQLKHKPIKKQLKPCKFSHGIPKISFVWTDKTEHYELELFFTVFGRTFRPDLYNPAFFIQAKIEPLKLYMLGSIEDYHLLCYFAQHQFKLAILKVHYNDFKGFFDQLSALYMVRTEQLVLHKVGHDKYPVLVIRGGYDINLTQ